MRGRWGGVRWVVQGLQGPQTKGAVVGVVTAVPVTVTVRVTVDGRGHASNQNTITPRSVNAAMNMSAMMHQMKAQTSGGKQP